MAKKKRSKTRTDFRKGHQGRVRQSDLTRSFHSGNTDELADVIQSERVSGKGELTRKRTVSEPSNALGVDAAAGEIAATQDFVSGRVISTHGLKSKVFADDGKTYECTIRQVLKSLSIDQRGVVVAGDQVLFRAEDDGNGMIEQILPRHGLISRRSRGQQHVIAANVDYLLIIASAAEPGIKPNLIDRFLLTAEHCEAEPIIVINKADLIDLTNLQPMLGAYAAMGYRVLLTSAQTGFNIDYLRCLLVGKQTVLAGQSGVGKSSLLNAVEPGLGLAVGAVSRDNDKGRHTTTAARLIPIQAGGAVFDTPGIRQFQLWDIDANEVAGLMPDFRPYVSRCRYPNCLHLSENECAVKDAVADSRIDPRRYDSYCHLLETDLLQT